VSDGVDQLPPETLREALRQLGVRDLPAGRAAALRELRATFAAPGGVKAILDAAPEAARQAFVRLAHDGPATVEALLGRGWWGHGMLPAPLDWLQRRALVVVAPDGRVQPVAEARDGFLALALDIKVPSPEPAAGEAVRVEAAGAVVVAPEPAALDRVLGVAGAALRAVAPTVAVSRLPVQAVEAALRAARIDLAGDTGVELAAHAPALPGTPEHAVGPRAIRELLDRAVQERRQVRLTYYPSSRGGATTERTVDPWSFRDDLLRGYCHLRGGERTFAVDRIGGATLLPTPLDHQA
jgi:hypothetical protein